MTNPKTDLLNMAFDECMTQFAAAIARADTALENRRNEIAMDVQASAANVALLESALEMFDALEQISMSAQTRRELAAAVEEHRAVVDAAAVRLKQAFTDRIRDIGRAAVAMECHFNSRTSAVGN
jgi:hypothetical protein